ncbi:MAG TPA: hypothetical protein DE312_01825 [Gallionella sp.]|jgi:hypothetical protein|nr:hypothetical protein [Gallionella sp.]OGS67263.1 MAG: hypothetical protein A2Z87_03500 [Gallionellales bacterium GWA2_54_124]OGT20102.1 MAG: hypothetical protein A2522_06105 [Gallionellales bacterium RIFOXYD12_FULL_53_10]OGT22666.1 MAG: hypothetical protein A3K00_10595 [Gallionellales bacterium RIFOXYD2_FULL_52_7]HCI52064.1 hypothetical protein [Gallionella sp.]
MLPRINLFIAWFLIPQTLGMGWVAFAGRMLLEVLGVNTHEGDIPGRLVGAVLIFGAVYLILHFRGSLPPEGNSTGKGFGFGQRLVLAANLLASLFCLFQFTQFLIESHDLRLVLNGFTDAFGYWVMALWVIGFSFLYQSSLPQSSNLSPTK